MDSELKHYLDERFQTLATKDDVQAVKIYVTEQTHSLRAYIDEQTGSLKKHSDDQTGQISRHH